MSSEITTEIHKKLGISLFNKVWELIDKKDRSREECELMINAAHASLYHWMQAGTAVNFARGEWQVSRVYSLCNRAEPALHHAENSLRICQENNIADFDLAFAYEALARASRVNQDAHKTAEFIALAREAAKGIKEKEDRDYFLSELGNIN